MIPKLELLEAPSLTAGSMFVNVLGQMVSSHCVHGYLQDTTSQLAQEDLPDLQLVIIASSVKSSQLTG
jgi:hypothetical protein